MRVRLSRSTPARAARIAVVGALIAGAAQAEPIPLTLPNLNPLTLIHGLPGARPVQPADRIGLASTVASHFVSEANAREMLLLDGESVRTELAIARRVTPTWAVGAVLPHVRHGGGVLDDAINDWHQWFGLTDGGRDAAPLDTLDFHYRRSDGTLLRMQTAGGGIGDAQLFADFAPAPAWSLQTTLKLPTGDSARLHGSGAADLAVILARQSPVASDPLALYGYLGVLGRGRGDVLPAQARTAVGLAQLGLAWTALPRLTLQMQLDGHTAFYRASDLAPFGPALQLTLGARWALAARTHLSCAFAEDVAVATGPDVAFQLALHVAY